MSAPKSDTDKMKSIDIIIPPIRKIKKKNNKKLRASRKTKVNIGNLGIPINTENITKDTYGSSVCEIQKPINHAAKTMKKVMFNPDKNQIFEIQCNNVKSLDDLDVNFSLEPSAEFKIEEVPEINIADLFNE
jgi:hypothetical protein